MAAAPTQVAEMPGLYGPFTLPERVVQKIWLRGDFDRYGAVLADGRRLVVLSPGRWNLLSGPDFKEAHLWLGDDEVSGDVEVHFHVEDWAAHRHVLNPAYANVVLHVVLFPPLKETGPARRGDGHEIPTLALLPLLPRDLEEYAADDALEIITGRDESPHLGGLAARSAIEIRQLLRDAAQTRWRQKVGLAGQRLKKLGWTAAAHHTALDILGYRQNRATMLAVAARYPLEAWIREGMGEEVYAQHRSQWQPQGVRPANHPLRRLRQYQAWCAARPDWPARLLAMADQFGRAGAAVQKTSLARAALGIRALRQSVATGLIAGTVAGPRLDNLICDGFLPLLAAHTRKDLYPYWFHWFTGDAPVRLKSALRRLDVTAAPQQPVTHGYMQGLLGWLLEQDGRANR